MSEAMKKFLSGLLNGVGAFSGALIAVMQGAEPASKEAVIVCCLTGFAIAAKDWKAALDAKKNQSTV